MCLAQLRNVTEAGVVADEGRMTRDEADVWSGKGSAG